MLHETQAVQLVRRRPRWSLRLLSPVIRTIGRRGHPGIDHRSAYSQSHYHRSSWRLTDRLTRRDPTEAAAAVRGSHSASHRVHCSLTSIYSSPQSTGHCLVFSVSRL